MYLKNYGVCLEKMKQINLKFKALKKHLLSALCIILSVAICCLTAACRGKGNAKAFSSFAEFSSTAAQSGTESSEQDSAAKMGLTVTSPEKNTVAVTEPYFTFSGSCDPAWPLLFNGEAIPTDAEGKFSHKASLNIGTNSFTLEHKGEAKNYTVNYRYAVINDYDPGDSRSFASGSTFAVTVSARAGAECTAAFNGQTVKLKRAADQEAVSGSAADESFCNFSGFFTLPSGNTSDLSLGKITFRASYKGINDTVYSGKIVCKKSDIPIIAEVTAFGAETFNGNSTDNWTRPTNSYLPAGTVDYVNGSYSAKDGKYTNNYLILRCGKRIYSDMPITPGNSRAQIAKTYSGVLPDHNELSVAGVTSDARRTYITLNTMWKAPFFLNYNSQGYSKPSTQDYTVAAVTFSYIDIEFCYATVFSGELELNGNPLFSAASVIPGNGSTTLRLRLKDTGEFYGWDCSYNSSGQLVFEFLHPPMGVLTDTNEYGIDLSGLKILVDAGHGGFDCGAAGNGMQEAERNLSLAYKLKAELEKTGATVLMTRTADSALQSPARVESYRKMKPDLLISVHHDSSTASSVNGFGSYYTTPFSMPLAKSVYNHTINTGIYNGGNRNKLAWHYFYMTRMTFCPAVLTENGFMGGSLDGAGIRDENTNLGKAKAIAEGVTEYLRSLI